MNMMTEVKGSDTLPQTETVTPSVPQSNAPTLASSAMLVEAEHLELGLGARKTSVPLPMSPTQNYAATGVATSTRNSSRTTPTLKSDTDTRHRDA
jgi:hypothetical protein